MMGAPLEPAMSDRDSGSHPGGEASEERIGATPKA